MVEGTSQTITNGSYSVVVGVGGARSTNVANPGSTGGDSTFNGYVAKGGAAGPDYGTHGGAGGCGAGGSEDLRNAGSSNQDPYSSTTNVAGYGHGGGAGGTYDNGAPPHGGGGGGGAGGVGTAANGGTATGGVGRANNIRTGANHTYCRGGNGYAANESAPMYEIANSGNGAHGVSSSGGGNTNSGNGASGIVVIRYAI